MVLADRTTVLNIVVAFTCVEHVKSNTMVSTGRFNTHYEFSVSSAMFRVCCWTSLECCMMGNSHMHMH